MHTVDLVRLAGVLGHKGAGLEHVKRRDGDAFAPGVGLFGPGEGGLLEAPVVAGAGVEQHRDEEQVDDAAGDLRRIVDPVVVPLLEEGRDTLHVADVEVLPATVRRDGLELVGAKVALRTRVSQFQLTGDTEGGVMECLLRALITSVTKFATSAMREGS